ncbi:hypothetical protein JCM3775_000578 [Rhodotorula graminis]
MARQRTVVALSLLAVLPLSASALPPPSTTATLAARAHLEPRQFLCGIFGTCDTSTSDAATASAVQQTPAADSAVPPAASSATAPTAPADTPAGTTATPTDAATVPPVGATASSTSAVGPVADTPTSAAPTPTSETSALAASTSASTPSTSSTSSTTPTSSSTSSSSGSTIIVTLTSVLTNADGSESTMTQESASAVPVAPKENSSGGGPSGKTWGIIGGVVGGIAVLAALLYVGYRLTQRRFSNLDADGDDIRWPELQPDGGANLATLNPQGTRRTGGAGFAMEKDHDDDDDDEFDDEGEDELDRKGAGATGGEWAAAEGSPRVGAGVGAGAAGHYGLGHNASEAAFFEGQGGLGPYEQYEGAYGQPHSPQQGARASYYDPYLPHAHSSDPALVPLSHAAGAGAGPYGAPVTYPPTFAHYGAQPAGRSTESLGQYRATSPRY